MKKIEMHDTKKHPCFNAEAKGKYGRVHLPVAPKCNIQCNFCDRKYDCVNESRPGVTSDVLSAERAGVYLDKVLEKEPRITVAGIAGPGDPFANPEATMATVRRIHKEHPEIMLCLSTNGMGVGPYIEEISRLNVGHVTVTICAVDPEIGAKVYRWVRDGKVIYQGVQGAKLLLSRQLAAVEKLKKFGVTVKINCIVIPGVNDHHVEAIAQKMKELGADLLNCMALFPNANTPFGKLKQPEKEEMEEIRNMAEQYLPQMRHCSRCRADAVGVLGEDRSEEFRSCLSSCSTKAVAEEKKAAQKAQEARSRVAVGTEEGVLVNQHLGEVTTFEIWEQKEEGFHKVEDREAPAKGGGLRRWHQVAAVLDDCRAVLISGVGEKPREVLEKSGITVAEASGFIEEGLRTVYEGRKLGVLKGRRIPTVQSKCSGSGGGCG